MQRSGLSDWPQRGRGWHIRTRRHLAATNRKMASFPLFPRTLTLVLDHAVTTWAVVNTANQSEKKLSDPSGFAGAPNSSVDSVLSALRGRL